MSTPQKNEYLNSADMFGCFVDLDKDSQQTSTFISTGVQEGKMLFKVPIAGIDYAFLQYMNKDNTIGLISTILLGKETNEFYSIWPTCAGKSVDVIVENMDFDTSNNLGYLTVEFPKIDMESVTVCVPLFAQHNDIKIQQHVNIELYGICMSIGKSPEEPFVVKEGPLYELMLKDWLKDNPGKTSSDYPGVIVQQNKGTAFIPKPYPDCYEFQSDILSVKETEFFGQPVYQLEVYPIRNPEKECFVSFYIYASKFVLGSYTPKVGDNVRGVLALGGFIK